MFRLFNRTKVKSWEINLMKKVINQLPNKYKVFLDQINEGLFRGVLINASDLEGYVAFTYNYDCVKKYENRNSRAFRISNIKVFDKKLSTYLNYTIYVSSGMINGYSIQGSKKYNIDIDKVDVKDYKIEIRDNSEYNELANILNLKERELLNPSEVYKIEIEGIEYFHILDLGNGDFIGIDKNKTIYKIKHNPLEITKIEANLENILKS